MKPYEFGVKLSSFWLFLQKFFETIELWLVDGAIENAVMRLTASMANGSS